VTHVYLAPRPADTARKGQLCNVVCRGRGPGPYNVLVEFSDGYRMVTCREKTKKGKPYSLRELKQMRLF
jgi:hypothetical protein